MTREEAELAASFPKFIDYYQPGDAGYGGYAVRIRVGRGYVEFDDFEALQDYVATLKVRPCAAVRCYESRAEGSMFCANHRYAKDR